MSVLYLWEELVLVNEKDRVYKRLLCIHQNSPLLSGPINGLQLDSN